MLDVISKDYVCNCFDTKPFIIPEPNILTIRTKCLPLFPNLLRTFKSRTKVCDGGICPWSGWERHLQAMISLTVLHRNKENEKCASCLAADTSFYKCLFSSFMSLAFPVTFAGVKERDIENVKTCLAKFLLRLNLIICSLLDLAEFLSDSEEGHDHTRQCVLHTVRVVLRHCAHSTPSYLSDFSPPPPPHPPVCPHSTPS